MNTSDSFHAKIEVSPYYKSTLSPKENKAFHLIADLGISAIKLKSGEDIAPGHSGVIDLGLEKPLVHDAQGVRGIIADFGPFDGKLRIVGYIEQLLG